MAQLCDAFNHFGVLLHALCFFSTEGAMTTQRADPLVCHAVTNRINSALSCHSATINVAMEASVWHPFHFPSVSVNYPIDEDKSIHILSSTM